MSLRLDAVGTICEVLRREKRDNVDQQYKRLAQLTPFVHRVGFPGEVLVGVRKHASNCCGAEALQKDQEFVPDVNPEGVTFTPPRPKRAFTDHEVMESAFFNEPCSSTMAGRRCWRRFVRGMLDDDPLFLSDAGKKHMLERSAPHSAFHGNCSGSDSAAQESVSTLRCARESLGTEEFVLAATRAGIGIQCMGSPPVLEKDFVLAAAARTRDRSVILAALAWQGSALQHAEEPLKRDREFVLAAVARNASALRYANALLKKEKEFVLDAVAISGRALRYADRKLRRDRKPCLSQSQETARPCGMPTSHSREIRSSCLQQWRETVRLYDMCTGRSGTTQTSC